MDDEAFLARFEARTWPQAQWHHREHIKVAYVYVARFPLEVAIAKMCAGIRALNAAHGVVETPTGGYHETMTQAWIRLVHVTFCEFGPSRNADEFVDTHRQLLSKRALLFFYSLDLIMSAEARCRFVSPDLAPFPSSVKDDAAPPISREG